MSMRMRRLPGAGFTLIELVVVILVLAILTSLALPAFRSFLHRNAVTSSANQLRADLQYARSEAVSRRAFTVLCPKAAGNNCAAGNALESNGWMAYRETAPGATASYNNGAGGDELLRVSDVDDTTVSVHVSGSVACAGSAGTGANSVCFDPTGSSLDGDTGVVIKVCAKNSEADPVGQNTEKVPGNRVVISPSGRIGIQKLAVSDDCN